MICHVLSSLRARRQAEWRRQGFHKKLWYFHSEEITSDYRHIVPRKNSLNLGCSQQFLHTHTDRNITYTLTHTHTNIVSASQSSSLSSLCSLGYFSSVWGFHPGCSTGGTDKSIWEKKLETKCLSVPPGL